MQIYKGGKGVANIYGREGGCRYEGGKGVADTKEVRGVACRYKGGKGCCMQI